MTRQHACPNLSWRDLADAAPQIHSAGRDLLFNPDQGEVAILATVDKRGRPAVAPVCPIFALRGIYVLAGENTPKVQHLLQQRSYALHALVGEDDREFQINGTARLVMDTDERAAVLAAVPFPEFDAADPIFELTIRRALAVTWPRPGSRDKFSWTADSGPEAGD